MNDSKRFRLRRVGLLPLRLSAAPIGHLDGAGLLSENLIWFDGWLSQHDASSIEMILETRGERIELSADSFPYPRSDLRWSNRNVSGYLFLAEVQSPLPAHTHIDRLLIRQQPGGPWYRLSPPSGVSLEPPGIGPFEDALERLSEPEHDRFRSRIEAHAVRATDHPVAIQKLLEIFAPPPPPASEPPEPPTDRTLPPRLGEPFETGLHEPVACWLSSCLVIDDENLFVSGWLWDAVHRVRDIQVLVDGSAPISVLRQVSRTMNTTVTEKIREAFGNEADRRHSLLGLVHLPEHRLERQRRVPRFELVLEDGARYSLNQPPVSWDPFRVRETMMQSLPEERYLDRQLLERHFLPAVEALSHRCRKAAPSHIADEIRLGSPNTSPPASLLIPVGGNFDLLAPQLALLGQDPEIREAELVLLLDAPQDPELTKHQVFDLARLYELSGKALFVEPRVGYASAINLAAEAAAGDRLVLMHSDTFPERPGWLSPLLGYLDENPDCGLVGPRLLADEATIWSCGWALRDDLEFDRICTPHHRGQGLPRHGESVDPTATVPAVSAACLVAGRQSFGELGGFTDGYVAGELEDIDLCLRHRRADRQVRYNPKVDIFHLGEQSRRRGVGWRRNAWADALNRLRLRHRWTEELSSPERDL